MISLSFIVALIVICAVLGLAYWAVGALGTPEPAARIVKVILVVFAVILLINLLLGLGGGHPLFSGPVFTR